MYFISYFIFLVSLRIGELILAKSNESWIKNRGAIEYGKGHYLVMVAMHSSFLLSLLGEYYYRQGNFNLWFFLIFLGLIGLKIWTLSSLGKYWNTKIFRLPEMKPIKSGPYKFVRHPNYIIVIGEIVVIPMVFHLYYTAILFSILNLFMLRHRIRIEEAAWQEGKGL